MRSFEGWFFNRWVQLAAAFVPGLTYFAWGRHFSDSSRGCSSSALFDRGVQSVLSPSLECIEHLCSGSPATLDY